MIQILKNFLGAKGSKGMGSDVMNKVFSRRVKQFKGGVISLYKLVNRKGQADSLLFKENSDVITLERDCSSQIDLMKS